MKLCVIGAGAAGICAAKNGIEFGCTVTVFEQSENVGGTWVYTDEVATDKNGLDVHSSMYQGLYTNLPKEVMGEFVLHGMSADGRTEGCFISQVIRTFQSPIRRHRTFQQLKCWIFLIPMPTTLTFASSSSLSITSFEFGLFWMTNGKLLSKTWKMRNTKLVSLMQLRFAMAITTRQSSRNTKVAIFTKEGSFTRTLIGGQPILKTRRFWLLALGQVASIWRTKFRKLHNALLCRTIWRSHRRQSFYRTSIKGLMSLVWLQTEPNSLTDHRKAIRLSSTALATNIAFRSYLPTVKSPARTIMCGHCSSTAWTSTDHRWPSSDSPSMFARIQCSISSRDSFWRFWLAGKIFHRNKKCWSITKLKKSLGWWGACANIKRTWWAKNSTFITIASPRPQASSHLNQFSPSSTTSAVNDFSTIWWISVKKFFEWSTMKRLCRSKN